MGKARGREAIAAELLALEALVAPELAQLEALKEEMRQISAKGAGGFTVVVPGHGSVVVRSARTAKFTGTVPGLNPELFLALTEAEREPLIANGVVVTLHQYTTPARASVTVKLQPAPAVSE